MFGRRSDAQGSAMPEFANRKKVWLGGDRHGQPVGNSPIKIPRGVSFKLDPEAHESALAALQLANLDDIGALEKMAAYQKRLHLDAENRFELAKMVRTDPWMIAHHRTQRRWPLYVLCAALLLVVGGQSVLLVRMLLRPTLSEVGRVSAIEPREGGSGQEGRAEGRVRKAVAKSTQMRTVGDP